jgi:hypothetical protein
MQEFNRALIAYRNAVRNRAFWESHGNHGDNRLSEAKTAEAAAASRVRRAAKAMGEES